MTLKKWFLITMVLLVSVVATVSVVRAISNQSILERNAAAGLKDPTPVLWINERAIPRGTLVALANTILATEDVSEEEAYQKAVNLLVQNALLLQEAHNRELFATDEEVDAHVQEQLSLAEKSPEAQAALNAQAEELGTTWDSPEFRDYIREYTKDLFPLEKLHAQLDEQAKGDDQLRMRLTIDLLNQLLPAASIRFDVEALPDGAKNVHVPDISEFPYSIAAQETIPPNS